MVCFKARFGKLSSEFEEIKFKWFRIENQSSSVALSLQEYKKYRFESKYQKNQAAHSPQQVGI